MEEREEGGASLRKKLEIFLAARLEKRLETQKEESKRAALRERFIFDNWFEYAASKVEKLQAATHVAKFSHPSIKKASDIYFEISETEREGLIGTHSVAWQSFQHDLSTGNAADLDGDIKEFLRISHSGRTVFDMILVQDEELKATVNPDPGRAEYILKALLSLKNTRNEKRSHVLSKQVFWLVHEDPSLDQNYHLLSPMLATSLAHAVFKTISESRFGASSKEGRNARHAGKAFDGEYHDYPGLAVQKMGGSNQQNVSQLNSERGGQNYLLASLPPHWQSREIYPPMREAFRTFKRRPEVWKILDGLKRFLETDPDPNMHTRDLRDDYVAMLVDELMLFTFDMHSLAPGWSADEKCELVVEEQFWLDPGRAHQDADFDKARQQSNWHEVVTDRAAGWLNRELSHKSPLSMGDPEHDYWEKQIGSVLKVFRRQVDDLQDALRDDDDNFSGEPA
ncbi:type I-F CRISPR-associated protein Csy1 [Halomonas sp. HNIBRBA4712]|uniref:type I-F CRISPR-associated protein Csy1 n=1 Tax=Halomonas sp. HNIBRBA4712 TaxID=3373087 RepID=UPI0037461ABB